MRMLPGRVDPARCEGGLANLNQEQTEGYFVANFERHHDDIGLLVE
jgi:hypothetical protein